MTGIAVAVGPCYTHDGLFMYDPDRVPVVLVDPVTGLPPDVDANGNPCDPDPEAMGRLVRRPYCPDCGRRLNAEARRRGLPALYDETDTAADLTRRAL